NRTSARNAHATAKRSVRMGSDLRERASPRYETVSRVKSSAPCPTSLTRRRACGTGKHGTMGLNMSEGWRRAWWPIVKALLAAVILGAVGWQFYADLRRLDWDDLHVQPAWLMLCGLLYLVGLGFSAWFWRLLLRTFDQHPRPLAVVRAYYIGHLGKYVPGKAWALFLRGALVQGANTRLSVAVVTAFYEVLTTMASGALLAAVIFFVRPPLVSGLTWSPLFTGVFLLALLAVPLF